jgi:hypothetical protein
MLWLFNGVKQTIIYFNDQYSNVINLNQKEITIMTKWEPLELEHIGITYLLKMMSDEYIVSVLVWDTGYKVTVYNIPNDQLARSDYFNNLELAIIAAQNYMRLL